MKIFLKALSSIAAGTFAVLGFSPFDIWIAPFLSLLFLILLLSGEGLRERSFLLFIYGLGFFLPLLHWSSIYVGATPWIILGIGQSIFIVLLTFAFPSGRLNIALFTSFFLLFEFLRSKWPFGGFGWGRAGFSQLDGPLEKWLQVGGVSLTGGVLALAAAIVGKTILDRNRYLPFALLPIIIFPTFLSPSAGAAIGEEEFRIGVIQGGVSQLGLDFNSTARDVFNRHFSESKSLLNQNKDIDILLWPENASDLDPFKTVEIRDEISRIVEKYQVPMVIGAVLQGESGPENASIMYSSDGQVGSIYRKRDLVPFGEYIPLRNIASRISPLVDSVRDFIPGDQLTVHRLRSLAFSPLICYEILDDKTVLDSVKSSNIGVVQTNNATFGRSWQSEQQFQMTRVRAFEYQIPFVVAATTGQSAHIGSDGEIMKSIPSFRSGSFVLTESPKQVRIPPISSSVQVMLAMLFPIYFYMRLLRNFLRKRVSSSHANS
jgi:apolipoprotein N-acyltransferase